MESHLDDGQIDELLQPDWSEGRESVFDPEVREDARTHLRICEICQARVREQERAMERLALLRTNSPGMPGLQCPPEDVWLEIAAGMATQDSETCLSHAANCDHCGYLLRQAVEDFAGELTPQEEAQIANLSSSTSGWRSSMAARLHGDQDAVRIAPAPASRWRSGFASFFSPFRLAFAAAIIGLIVLGLRDYLRSALDANQGFTTNAGVSRLEEEVRRQKAQIDELTAELNKPGDATVGSSLKQAEEVAAVSLTLDSSLTRGPGSMNRLAIPPGAEIVRIAVPMSAIPEGVIHEELLTVERRRKWSQEMQASDGEKKSGRLTLLVPAYLLTPDDYLIVLSRESPKGLEEIATRVFRVSR